MSGDPRKPVVVPDAARQDAIRARLEPKADAYDNLVRVLRLLPQPSAAMGEDMVWLLDKRIRELKPKPDAESHDHNI